jgi:hypothetical protein
MEKTRAINTIPVKIAALAVFCHGKKIGIQSKAHNLYRRRSEAWTPAIVNGDRYEG